MALPVIHFALLKMKEITLLFENLQQMMKQRLYIFHLFKNCLLIRSLVLLNDLLFSGFFPILRH